MDNFRTVVAVLVVLLAFTCFQLIANYSLREGVRRDVRKQIDSSDVQMLRHHDQLKAAAGLTVRLAKSLRQVEAEMAAAKTSSADLAKVVGDLVDEVEKKLGALKTSLRGIEKKLAGLGGGADEVGRTQASLKQLRQQVGQVGASVRSASKDAAGALKALRNLQVELAEHKRIVKTSALSSMRSDIRQIQGKLKQLTSALQSKEAKGGGT